MKRNEPSAQVDSASRRFPITMPFCARMPLCSAVVAMLLGGCTGKPNQANIELRKQIQSLQSRIETLDRQHDTDLATIRGLQDQQHVLPTLPENRLDKLFTTHGLRLGRLTGGADLDLQKPGDEGIKVYIVPIDGTGDELKAAGSFTVELFDLAKSDDNLIGRWEFSDQQSRENWYGKALLYSYVLTCPWQQRAPEHTDLTLKVSFRDELTQRIFKIQQVIQVQLPPGKTE